MTQEVISEQIEQLRHKQHIDRIVQVNKNEYQVSYSPQLTESPYSHLSFSINVIIPDNYPEAPPTLVFVDKIYHLNVDQVTGEVNMPILNSDWSPYLTLTAVFSSLDSILEEPDQQYAASSALINEYLNEPEKYLQNIEHTIQMSNDGILLNESHSVAEQVDVIGEPRINMADLAGSFQSQSHESGSEKNLGDVSEIPKLKHPTNDNIGVKKSEEIKIELLSEPSSDPGIELGTPSSKDKKENGGKKQQLLPQKREIPAEVVKEKNFQLNQPKCKEQPRKVVKLTDNLHIPQSSEFEEVRANLLKADHMLELLMSESEGMQETLKRVGVGRLRSKLQVKHQRILQMIEQTLELSSSLRERLFEKLKADTKLLLR